MKKIKIISIIMLALILMVGCGNKEKQAKESKQETFTVGFDKDFPPMGFVGDDGEFTGFDLALATEVAKRINYKLKLQPIAWDSKDMELESKNIDCVWNGFTITGREDKYTWSDIYMENRQVFVVKEGSDINSKADLKGKVVCVQSDSSAEAAISKDKELEKSFKEYVKAADYNAALMDLDTGAIDVVAMDEIVARYRIGKKGGKYKILDEALLSEGYGVGFLLGNTELRDKVQEALIAMKKDGTMEKISTEWFGKDITTIKAD